MKTYHLLLLLIGISACTGVPKYVPKDTTKTEEIFGGVDVTDQSPLRNYVVNVLTETDKAIDFHCTASAISKRVILTAAHCMPEGTKTVHVGFGINEADDTIKPIKVDKVIINPEYLKTKSVGHGDVALLFLTKDIPDSIEIVNLPEGINFDDSFNFTAIGYGYTYGGIEKAGFPPNNGGTLRTVDLISKNYNINKNPETFNVDQTLGRGICEGDSGGPALVFIANNFYVVGTVSGVIFYPKIIDADRAKNGPGDICRFSSVYMKTAFFVSWIHQTIADYEAQQASAPPAGPRSSTGGH